MLGRADLLLFSVSAILTIDTLASAASMGLTWFGWWAITMVLFFVPYGLITAELGAAWPGEGGLYVWVREAMGPRWGSLAAWFYWINNAYWVPAVYMVFAGTFHSIFLRAHLPPSLQEGPGATWLQTFIALAVTWMTVGIGVVRLQVSKWVPNVGAVVKVAIFVGAGRARHPVPPLRQPARQRVHAGAASSPTPARRCASCPCSSTTRSASS